MSADEQLPILNPGEMVKRRFRIDKKLGEGHFGAVYQCTDTKDGELYAVEIESVKAQIQVLKMVVTVLNELKQTGGTHRLDIVEYGRNVIYNYAVMTLPGKSLQDLIKAAPGCKFSLGTAVRVGIQCMEALRDFHSIGYLHRDIKPGNFAQGRVEKGQHRNLFILNFRMVRKYINESGKIRIPRTVPGSKIFGFRGTVRYASLACHQHQELSRKDDLENWFYQQIEITVGRVPWAEIQDWDEVGRQKASTRQSGELLAGCPPKYLSILEHIDKLTYWDAPDYALIIGILREIMVETGTTDQDPYDWETASAGTTASGEVGAGATGGVEAGAPGGVEAGTPGGVEVGAPVGVEAGALGGVGAGAPATEKLDATAGSGSGASPGAENTNIN